MATSKKSKAMRRRPAPAAQEERSNAPSQREEHVLTNNGGGLQQTLVFGSKPVNPRRQYRLKAKRAGRSKARFVATAAYS